MEKRIMRFVVVLFSIPLILILLIMILSTNEKKMNVSYNEKYIELDSFIYDKIYFHDIEKLMLLTNDDMKIQKQGSGFKNNNFFSGEAVVEGIGCCRAYIYLHNSDYILVDSKKDIIFNLETGSETKKLYEKLKYIYSEEIN